MLDKEESGKKSLGSCSLFIIARALIRILIAHGLRHGPIYDQGWILACWSGPHGGLLALVLASELRQFIKADSKKLSMLLPRMELKSAV